ncbi:major tail protein [Lacticaseibacillus saniviri]|uniref:Major tail protein n=1 Tax=Lacticaseibacillus saniviri JCM 17471 = DSM 24301 TaxID=1293598 RepID=A0A0R2MV74_9LACO|nr:major tail protein [Lacticaseibacillus saniviri]KRO17414.1 major tail protein [Lacticaseibacillus saniviri JCM 17471 = DSM 24301]
MTLVGFKRIKIQPFDADDKPSGNLIVIEGKPNQGATSTAEISGLSKEATKVAGSDIDYWISRKGVGDVKVEFGILDFPDGASDRVLGYQVNENKITYMGNTTEAPYVGVTMEQEDAQGNKAVLGFFRGTMARDKISAKTLDPAETFKPEAETYTLSVIASTDDGPQNGQYVGKYVGTDAAVFEELEKEVLKTATTTAPVTDPKNQG